MCLDWFDNEGSSLHIDAATRPTVLILPGLTGKYLQYCDFGLRLSIHLQGCSQKKIMTEAMSMVKFSS